MENNSHFHWAEGFKYAIEGMKGFFILNGAGTISILTFVGSSQSGDNRLVYAMLAFAVGALLSPISFVSAYLAQLCYGNEETDSAWRFHKLTYALVSIGVIAFLIGIYFASRALVDLP